jgi:hypothetical protein
MALPPVLYKRSEGAMLIGISPGDISVEFGNALLALSLGAIAVILVIVYIENISAGFRRMFWLFNPRALLARFRVWWLLHRVTH